MKWAFKDYTHSNALYAYKIKGMTICGTYFRDVPSYLVLAPPSSGIVFSDMVTPEIKSWLRATMSKRNRSRKPYHYLYEIFWPNARIGIGFYDRDDAAHFMLVFNGD